MGENDSLAKRIVYDLGGNWYGHYGTVPGPWHSACDRSVTVRNHQTNPDDVCIYSHAGDDVLAIKAEWRARGILSRPSKFDRRVGVAFKTKITVAHQNKVDASNVRTAWWLWHKLSRPAPGTVVTEYLKWRGHRPRSIPANDPISTAERAASASCNDMRGEIGQRATLRRIRIWSRTNFAASI